MRATHQAPSSHDGSPHEGQHSVPLEHAAHTTAAIPAKTTLYGRATSAARGSGGQAGRVVGRQVIRDAREGREGGARGSPSRFTIKEGEGQGGVGSIPLPSSSCPLPGNS